MPSSPVIVKSITVDAADWFVEIVKLDICELVMFPLISKLTVEPSSVVAGITVAEGFSVGDG